MRTIVAADLHGVTAALRSLISPFVSEAIFVSPWERDGCPFASEQQAHAALIANDGIESYADKISALAGDEPAFIIAFSVGASAAWLHSASGKGHPDSQATLFYGSRIRDYSSLIPRFAITAVFAENEASFSPAGLAQIIASDRVHTVIESGTAHGFMNPLSPNFATRQCLFHLQRLRTEVARFSARF